MINVVNSGYIFFMASQYWWGIRGMLYRGLIFADENEDVANLKSVYAAKEQGRMQEVFLHRKYNDRSA